MHCWGANALPGRKCCICAPAVMDMCLGILLGLHVDSEARTVHTGARLRFASVPVVTHACTCPHLPGLSGCRFLSHDGWYAISLVLSVRVDFLAWVCTKKRARVRRRCQRERARAKVA